jgi:hypothetical protein
MLASSRRHATSIQTGSAERRPACATPAGASGRNPTPSRRRRSRYGFSLIELLVAIVLLDVALLVLVSATAVSARQFAEARQRARAAAAIQNRLEWALATPCGQSAAGEGSPFPGALEEWRIQVIPGGIRELHDAILVDDPRGAFPSHIVSRMPC